MNTIQLDLVEKFTAFDHYQSECQNQFIDIVKTIQDNDVNRKEVVAVLMQVRKCSEPQAQLWYAKAKRTINDEEVLKAMIEGKIEMRPTVVETHKSK